MDVSSLRNNVNSEIKEFCLQTPDSARAAWPAWATAKDLQYRLLEPVRAMRFQRGERKGASAKVTRQRAGHGLYCN